MSDERQGKIIGDDILGTLKLLSAFLSGCLLAYSRKYDFQKVSIYLYFSDIYVIQQCWNVLTNEKSANLHIFDDLRKFFTETLT